MRAKSQYEGVAFNGNFAEFQVDWMDALTSLGEAGIHKSSKDLFLDYLAKLGQGKRIQIMSDQRFWPIKPKPGEQPVFRKAQSWQEAAILAREMCLVVDAGKALSDRSYSQQDAKGTGKGKKGVWRSWRSWGTWAWKNDSG